MEVAEIGKFAIVAHFEIGELGFDIITHKERVIEIAQESNLSKIYHDNGTYQQEEAEYKPNVRRETGKKVETILVI